MCSVLEGLRCFVFQKYSGKEFTFAGGHDEVGLVPLVSYSGNIQNVQVRNFRFVQILEMNKFRLYKTTKEIS
jgi:hypothetical protein